MSEFEKTVEIMRRAFLSGDRAALSKAALAAVKLTDGLERPPKHLRRVKREWAAMSRYVSGDVRGALRAFRRLAWFAPEDYKIFYKKVINHEF